MTRRAWLTPGDAPGTMTCHPVLVPSGLEYEAAFRGALLLLCDPDNWEPFGQQSPEDIAQAFYEAFVATIADWDNGCA